MNQKRRETLSWISIGLAVLGLMFIPAIVPQLGLGATSVFGSPMGEETIGNKPLNDLNYKGWPKIMPVANHTSRVYHTWVNGDEMFYFQSSVAQLNDLLEEFSKLPNQTKEVVFLPESEKVSSFDQSQSFAFNCRMHLVGGIASRMTQLNKGDNYWPADPQLTVYASDELDLNKLTIPKQLTLVTLAELKSRYKDGLSSTDQNVAGWGVGYLARLDRFDAEALKMIATTCEGDNAWVALNAIASMSSFGPKAKDYIPMLERISESPVESNAMAAKKAIKEIRAVLNEKSLASFDEKDAIQRKQIQRVQEFIESKRGL